MLWIVLAAAILGSGLVLILVRHASLELARNAEHEDQPGVQSAVTFHLRRDDEALAALLDGLHAALEDAGADASTFQARGEGFELDGMLGVDSFRVSVARIEPHEDALPASHEPFLLLLHARTLGRYRYVAPPNNETTKTLLAAIAVGLRKSRDVHAITWQSRKDAGASVTS